MSPVSRASILLRHGETSTVSRACILVSSIGYFIKYTTRRQISNRFFDGGLMMQDDSAMSVILFLPLSLSFSLSYFSVFESGHSWLEMSKCFLRAICVLNCSSTRNRRDYKSRESLSDNIVIFAASILKQCGTNSLAQ